MGREKRIAEQRAKELAQQAKRTTAEASVPSSETEPAAPVVESRSGGTTGAKVITQVILLYAVPIIVILLVGKLILKL